MPSSQKQISPNDLIDFIGEYSRVYIASGGPTSRLEDSLELLGKDNGYRTEILATPTGIFTSVSRPDIPTHTSVCRIKSAGINLGKLCWLESILRDLDHKKITLNQAYKILHSRKFRKPTYNTFQTLIAAFISGFCVSYSAYGKTIAALVSAAIASITWWITVPALSKLVPSSIFRDFAGAVTTLTLSAICATIYKAPFDAFSIGGIVMLVPGLSLTTAISEIADQNLISGTSKLMQSILTLMALGLAFLLFNDFSRSVDLTTDILYSKRIVHPALFSMGLFSVSLLCFGVIFKVPRKSLFFATVTGLVGWNTLRYIDSSKFLAAAPFFASFAVGLVSLSVGKIFKVPSQVYSVPGIIALLPGLLALTSFQSFAVGEGDHGVELSFRVALTAASITFGLFTARIPFVLGKARKFQWNERN